MEREEANFLNYDGPPLTFAPFSLLLFGGEGGGEESYASFSFHVLPESSFFSFIASPPPSSPQHAASTIIRKEGDSISIYPGESRHPTTK